MDNDTTFGFRSSERHQAPQSIITYFSGVDYTPFALTSALYNDTIAFIYACSEGHKALQSNVTSFSGFSFAPATLTSVVTLA